MRKSVKNILVGLTAATLAFGALSVAGCDKPFKTPSGIPEGETVSNGGFVVGKGEYYYFINGVETYTSDNTYGAPVKGSLMRVKQSEVGKEEGEVVIPSLMVAGDKTAGIFVYGDRVYYATPTNVKNTTGVVENTYLDFASAKLDGTDRKTYFRLSSNTTVYRFVEAGEGKTVYCIYAEGSGPYTLHSYNTATETDVVLASNATAYETNAGDVTDPWIYYTMPVSENLDDPDSVINFSYNQIYRIRADWTESAAPETYDGAPYTYEWDADYLKENNNTAPYTNLGELVLDGVGTNDFSTYKTQFNHGKGTPESPLGYTYTLRTYANGGLYFTRSQTSTQSGTTGADGALYYVAASDLKEGWDSIGANAAKNLDVVAKPVEASGKATDSAMFYLDDKGGHHYLYVGNSNLNRVDVAADGSVEKEIAVAYGIGEATIVSLDMTSDPTYDYAYLTRTNGSGRSVERAVFNGADEKYSNLPYTDASGNKENNDAYAVVKLLDVQHANDWYPYDLVGTRLFFADAQTFGSTSYNYVSSVSLADKNGKLKDNVSLKAFSDLYDELMNTDSAKGYLAKLTSDRGNSKLSNAIKYYFYTGETEQFYANIEYAVENGQKATSLYTEEEKKLFDDFVNAKGATENRFKDADGNSYRNYSYFVSALGTMNEADAEAYDSYWEVTGLEHYTVPETAKKSLPAWAWALIGVGIGLVVGGAGVAVYFIIRKKKRANETTEKKPYVETKVDKDIDVYDFEPEPQPAEETATSVEGPTEEQPAETVEGPAEEQPVEGPAEPAETTDTPTEPTDGSEE